MPKNKNILNCLTLKRTEILDKGKKIERVVTQYLIANGMSMGRWTVHFGVHCLADTFDTQRYLHIQHKENKNSIIETYTIQKQEKEIAIINNSEFEKTINSKDRVERVLRGLNNNPEIVNGNMAVSYSDEGFALFEVIMNKSEKLIISFTGTAS